MCFPSHVIRAQAFSEDHGFFFLLDKDFRCKTYKNQLETEHRKEQICGLDFSMNDLPVIRDLRYAQGILGSPGGKHCKSLERNIWRKVVSSSKAVVLIKE